MKNITVKNFQGNEYTGKWNEKVYSSKIAGREDLLRIYVDNQAMHITKEEYKKISDNIERSLNEMKERESLNASIKAKELIEKMTLQDRYNLASKLIFDITNELDQDTDEYDEIKNAINKNIAILMRYM